MQDRTELQVTVHGDGYEWVRAKSPSAGGEERDYITTGLMWGHGLLNPKTYLYNPLEIGALFRVFASMLPTKEDILSFANQYGLLGGSRPDEEDIGELIPLPDAPYPKTKESVPAGYGEPLERWQQEILGMAEAVDLWDCIERDDFGTLQARFEWTKDKSDTTVLLYRPVWWDETRPQRRIIVSQSTMAAHARGGVHVSGFRVQHPADLVTPALVRLHELVNEKLYRAVTPVFMWASRADAAAFEFHTPNLLTALWLSLALAIIGRKHFRVCKECGKWFEIPSGSTRSKRTHCSNRCRQAAYRRRKNAEEAASRELSPK